MVLKVIFQKQKFRVNDFRLAFEDLKMHLKNKKFDAIFNIRLE